MQSHSSLVGDYLRARRDRTRPEDVGLPREPGRRVAGLRREEVALLAGISAEYYLRLEQGRDHQPSEQVIAALARALLLDEDAQAHLRRLARPVPRRRRGPRAALATDPALIGLLDRRSGVPAFVVDDCLDVVASNALASMLGTGMRPGANRVTRMFTDVDREQYPGWHDRAREIVGVLRMRADPADPRLLDIVGHLQIQDADFAALWARHDVHVDTSGTCREMVDPFGAVEFEWENLVVPGHEGLTLTTLFAPPGSHAAAVTAYLRAGVDGQHTATSTADVARV